jgi:hypothetical protein
MKRTIYLMAPSNFFTGGPLSTHQLASILNKYSKYDVKIFYGPKVKKSPVHNEFKKFKLSHTFDIIDSKKNFLIIPEHYPSLDEALKFKKIKKIIYWLSVDNYINSKFRHQYNRLTRAFIKIPYFLIYLFNKITFFYFGILTLKDYLKVYYNFFNFNSFKELKQGKIHIAQSSYASNYVKNKLINAKLILIEDQQRELYKKIYNKNVKLIPKLKENIVSYNATKSNEFIFSIINYDKNIKFVPIRGLTAIQMTNLLMRSKVYLDFGYHPGKDRAPREAVLFGNCVITNLKGSAFFYNDVTISKDFKFYESHKNLIKINKLIYSILYNYPRYFKKMNKYKKKILNENNVEIKQVKKFLKLINSV